MHKILLKQSPQHKPKAITPMAHSSGKFGYVMLGPVQIGGQAETLASKLRKLADELDRPVNRSARSLLQPFPKELDKPETAWPWLLKNRPWLFTGINIKSEPYYHYLEDAGPDAADDLQVAIKAGCTSDSSKADIAEALTGSRKYGGQDYYDRILPVWEALQSSSSTDKKTNILDFKREEAA